MVVLKNIRLNTLLIALALVLSFVDALQLLTTHAALATALACSAPTTNVNGKVDLDWNNPQLVNPQGAEAKIITNMWDTGVKLPWKIDGAVRAGDSFTYDVTVAEVDTGQSILRPTAERPFDVRSATGVVVDCGMWGIDSNVTVILNENVNSVAEWAGSVTTSAMIQYTGPANEQFEVQVGDKALSCNANMVAHPTGEAHTAKEDWIGVSDSEDGDENKSITQRVILPAGDSAVIGTSIVDEVPADDNWSYGCDTVVDYVKKHAFVVVDPTTPEGQCLSKDTSKDTFGAGSTVKCTPQKLTVTIPEIPVNQSAVVEVPTRVEGAKRAADVVSKFSNTVTFDVPGKKVSPVMKATRFGASADAFARRSFSVTTKVDGELPDNAKNLEYTPTITLKSDSNPPINKIYQATVKAGESDSYPGALPLGTEATISEGGLPLADGVTLNEVESRVFDTTQGVTLKASNREATFTLSEDHLFALKLNNQLMPAPEPAPKSTLMPTPTPTPTPSTPPARGRVRTGADAANVGILAGIVALAGGSLVAVKRRQR